MNLLDSGILTQCCITHLVKFHVLINIGIIETFKTFIIDNKTKIKTKEHESLKEYFDGKDDKHALPSAISSFSIISHNQTNEELELEL